jgi:hypothetical protein
MDLQQYERAAIESKLKSKGYKDFEAALAVDFWTAKLPATFKYKTPFAAIEADCKSSWGSRVFKHADWVDGMSLVQAGETPNEEGFNNRFHDIENDLDRLGASVDQAFECVNELRATLAAVLNEISAQFDLVAAVIAACCGKMPATPQATLADGVVLGHIELREEVEMIVVAGSDGHIVLFPKGGGPGPTPGNGVFDPMESRSAKVMRLLALHPEIGERFQRVSVSKEGLVEAFGDIQVEGDLPLRELIDVVPSGVNFKGLGALVVGLAESENATVKGARGADAVIAGVFSKRVASVQAAPLETFTAIGIDARNALVAGGVRTVGDLAGMSAERVHAALTQGGVDVGVGEAGAMVGAAQVMGFFG